jgi:putative transposase
MATSLSSIMVHLVFSTKHRERIITPEIEPELYKYLAKVFRAYKSPSLTIGGTENHLHILFSLARTISVADLVEEVKSSSSGWIKTKGTEFAKFHWQTGYGAFSIGQSNVPALKRYIANQKEHHRRRTFETEYRGLLRKYEMEIDEKYLWD